MAPEPSYDLLADFILHGVIVKLMLETTEGIVALRVATINASLVPANYLKSELIRYMMERTTLSSNLMRGWALALACGGGQLKCRMAVMWHTEL